MDNEIALAKVPSGFQELKPLDEMMAFIGPIYWKRAHELMIMGFYVQSRHCNPRGVCHGGVLSSFADIVLGFNASLAAKKAGPTISFTLDFLQATLAGEWIEARCEVLRHTPGFAFSQCILTADGKPAVRASASFRLKFPPLDYTPDA